MPVSAQVLCYTGEMFSAFVSENKVWAVGKCVELRHRSDITWYFHGTSHDHDLFRPHAGRSIFSCRHSQIFQMADSNDRDIIHAILSQNAENFFVESD